jgi:copper resistance protein D
MISYELVVWLHIVAAAVWIGGMLFFALVVVPAVRKSSGGTALLRDIGGRLGVLGWVLLALLMITGAANLRFHGIGWTTLSERGFWATGFGHTLAIKLSLVAALMAATLVHDALARRAPQSARTIAIWSGRAILLLSLAVLFYAVALVRGGP